MDWDGKSEHLNWKRQGEFTPCACDKCNFCLNGFTTVIAHKRKMEATIVYRCNKRVATEECNEDRVNLQQGVVTAGCATTSRTQRSVLKFGEARVNYQDWVVFSVRKLFARVAGRRGMISI